MTVRPRPGHPLPAMLAALALGVLTSVAVACGEERGGLLTASRAENLQEDLDRIDELVAAGRCEAVDGRLASLRKQVQGLPERTDARLRERLERGVARLERQAPDECSGQRRTTETQPETTPPETTPPPVTTTTAPETEPKPTVPTTTTKPPPTATQPPPTATQPPPPSTDEEPGGGTGGGNRGGGGSGGDGDDGQGDSGGSEAPITGQGGS